MAADFFITGDTRLDTSGVEKGISSMTVAAGNLISDLVKTAGSKLAGLATSSVSVGRNFDAAMSQVAATMGSTVDQIDGLTKVAKEMGSATKFSATEAAEALNYLADVNMITRRSYKDLDTAMRKATQIRNRKE